MRNRPSRVSKDSKDPNDLAGARRAAVAILARRAATRQQVIDGLTRRGYARATAEAAADEMVKRGYIDDQAFALSWAGAYRRRGRGRRAIVEGLLAKGFDEAAADAAAAAALPPEEELELVEQVAERWVAGKKIPDDYPGQQRLVARLYAHLQRRGFPAGACRKVALAAVARRTGEAPVQLDNNF